MQIQLTLKKCSKHSKLMDSICLSSQCSQQILLCQTCTAPKHPHFNVSIPEFKTIFSQKVAEKRSKLQLVNYDETPIQSIGKNYKAEIEQDQLKLIEGIMKELKEDKKAIVEEITRSSQLFADKHIKVLKKVENIKLVRNYDATTLLLKLKMAPAQQVAALRDAYLTLNRMSDEELLILREEKAMRNRLMKYVKEKNLGNFVEKLKETVMIKKSQVRGLAMNRQRTGSTEKVLRRGNAMFDRRRSSNDELAPSPKPGVRA